MDGSETAYYRLLVRDGWCPYCHVRLNRKNSSIDHIHPQSVKGGTRFWSNETGVCLNCNRDKADMSLLEFLMTGKKPREIQPVAVLSLRELSRIGKHSSWRFPLARFGYKPTKKDKNKRLRPLKVRAIISP